jgi:hypothetical protein
MVVGWREEAKYQLDKANVKIEGEECRVQRNGISRRDDEGARAVKDDKCSKQDSRAFFTRRLERWLFARAVQCYRAIPIEEQAYNGQRRLGSTFVVVVVCGAGHATDCDVNADWS